MRICSNISPYMRRPLVIYIWLCNCSILNFYMRKIWFYQCMRRGRQLLWWIHYVHKLLQESLKRRRWYAVHCCTAALLAAGFYPAISHCWEGLERKSGGERPIAAPPPCLPQVAALQPTAAQLAAGGTGLLCREPRYNCRHRTACPGDCGVTAVCSLLYQTGVGGIHHQAIVLQEIHP